MPLNRDYVGRQYPADEPYEVSREKIRSFADAIGDDSPLCRNRSAAQAAGYADVVAPPTFLTVLNFRYAASSPVVDPGLGLNYALVVHGEQRFVHHRPVVAGDVLHSVASIEDIRVAGRNELMVTKTEVTDDTGEPIATIYSTIVSRGTAGSTREG